MRSTIVRRVFSVRLIYKTRECLILKHHKLWKYFEKNILCLLLLIKWSTDVPPLSLGLVDGECEEVMWMSAIEKGIKISWRVSMFAWRFISDVGKTRSCLINIIKETRYSARIGKREIPIAKLYLKPEIVQWDLSNKIYIWVRDEIMI